MSEPLKFVGTSRDAGNEKCLLVHFNRRLNNDEMRSLHDTLRAQLAAQRPAGDEREAFETFISNDYSDISKKNSGYCHPCVDAAWSGWQARSKLEFK